MFVKVHLYRRRSLIGRLICWQTRGIYNHVAIELNGTIYESDWPYGVVARPRTAKEDDTDVYRVRCLHEEARLIEHFLLRQAGKPYDMTMVLRFVSRRQASRASGGKWFCSELVFAAFKHAGVELLARTEPWEVSPALLARSPLLIA